jgi:hypothetical protein
MDASLADLVPWLTTVNVWFMTATAIAGLIAFLRWSPPVRRLLPRRDRTGWQGRFEGLWSQLDGRLLAGVWILLFTLSLGDGGLIWTDSWRPVKDLFTLLQPLAGVLLVPVTAGLYVYKRAVPQVSADESDERERQIQGAVYRRAHAIVLVLLAVFAGLLAFNPHISVYIAKSAEARGVQLLDVVLPMFLLLFMLPSVAYAWLEPHREPDGSDARVDGLVGAGAP